MPKKTLNDFLADLEFNPLLARFFDDAEICERYGRDFGKIAYGPPSGVFMPETEAELHAFIRLANKHQVIIRVRGQGNSVTGHTLGCEMAIDLKNLPKNFSFQNKGQKRSIRASGHATWEELLNVALNAGYRPVILTDYLRLSLAGTLSVGGLGGASYREGSQADHVLSMRILAFSGEVFACSRQENSELFYAALCGLGLVGIILEAELALVPAKKNVSSKKFFYKNREQFLSDQLQFFAQGEADYLSGTITKQAGEWVYIIKAASFYETQAADLTGSIQSASDTMEATQKTFEEFTGAVTQFVSGLANAGKFDVPHPWLTLLLPQGIVQEVVCEALTSPYLKGDEPILLYPLRQNALTCPNFVRPEGDIIYLFCLLYNSGLSADHDIRTHEIVKHNKSLYTFAKRLGGCRYPIDSIPFFEEDWQEHFGQRWPQFLQAKSMYDPKSLVPIFR